MINFKPTIVGLLKEINQNVVESFPQDWSEFPVIVYEEEANTPHTLTTAGEAMSLLRYRIDIYSNRSTSALKNQINDKLASIGFVRVFSADTSDLAGRRHTVMRFEGVIDIENRKIYKN